MLANIWIYLEQKIIEQISQCKLLFWTRPVSYWFQDCATKYDCWTFRPAFGCSSLHWLIWVLFMPFCTKEYISDKLNSYPPPPTSNFPHVFAQRSFFCAKRVSKIIVPPKEMLLWWIEVEVSTIKIVKDELFKSIFLLLQLLELSSSGS